MEPKKTKKESAPEVALKNSDIKILIILAIIIAALTAWYVVAPSRDDRSAIQQDEAQKQTIEFEKIRFEQNIKPLTSEELQKQESELEKIRFEQNIKPLTSEELQKQTEAILRIKSEQLGD